jgi:hypothetical protein
VDQQYNGVAGTVWIHVMDDATVSADLLDVELQENVSGDVFTIDAYSTPSVKAMTCQASGEL